VFRRKRRVRIHQILGGPTIEGIQLSRRPIAGHYIVIVAKVLEERDDGEIRDRKFDAEQVEIPKDRVTAIEVLGS
jgi:hypothetical protein